MIEMPPALEGAWHTHGYYGSVSHNVKAIYQRYLGWYDGNPARLWKLSPEDGAKRYVEFMGGADEVVKKARRSVAAGELRWAAEVLDHVVFAAPDHAEAKSLLADVFEQLGYGSENGTWRCEFLSARPSCAPETSAHRSAPCRPTSSPTSARRCCSTPSPSRSTGRRPGTSTWPSAGACPTTACRIA